MRAVRSQPDDAAEQAAEAEAVDGVAVVVGVVGSLAGYASS
jgi:hypothetical protein